MEIALYDMVDGGFNWVEIDTYLAEFGAAWVSWRLDNKWHSDLKDSPGFESDGPCVFIRLDGGKIEREKIHALQLIVTGEFFSESILNDALRYSDSVEVSICLQLLKNGIINFKNRIILQDFACRLSAKL